MQQLPGGFSQETFISTIPESLEGMLETSYFFYLFHMHIKTNYRLIQYKKTELWQLELAPSCLKQFTKQSFFR